MASNTPNNVRPRSDSYISRYSVPELYVGGNRLDVATPSKIKDFVATHGGHTVIEKVRTGNAMMITDSG